MDKSFIKTDEEYGVLGTVARWLDIISIITHFIYVPVFWIYVLSSFANYYGSFGTTSPLGTITLGKLIDMTGYLYMAISTVGIILSIFYIINNSTEDTLGQKIKNIKILTSLSLILLILFLFFHI